MESNFQTRFKGKRMSGRIRKIFKIGVFCFAIIAALYTSKSFAKAADRNQGIYKLSASELKIEQGGKYQLSLHVITDGAIQTVKNVKWTSDNKKAVIVDENGWLLPSGMGKAVITAKANGKKLMCKAKIVKKGRIAEQFYGLWKTQNGKKLEFYPDGMSASLETIARTATGKNYRITGKISYVESLGEQSICFQVKKESKSVSVTLTKTLEEPDVIKVYIGKGGFFDFIFKDAPKTVLLRGKEKRQKQYIFLGDSRFVGMSQTECGKKDVYIAKVSQGLRWFMEQRAKMERYDSYSSVFIIGFGANDLYNAKRYADYVNGLRLRGKVYFCTVGPVDEVRGKNHGYQIKNSQIQNFNKVITDHAKNYKVIPMYQKLMKSGFRTVDGVHYKSSTYATLYQYLRRSALPWIGVAEK